jgi:hypothetical protein
MRFSRDSWQVLATGVPYQPVPCRSGYRGRQSLVSKRCRRFLGGNQTCASSTLLCSSRLSFYSALPALPRPRQRITAPTSRREYGPGVPDSHVRSRLQRQYQLSDRLPRPDVCGRLHHPGARRIPQRREIARARLRGRVLRQARPDHQRDMNRGTWPTRKPRANICEQQHRVQHSFFARSSENYGRATQNPPLPEGTRCICCAAVDSADNPVDVGAGTGHRGSTCA